MAGERLTQSAPSHDLLACEIFLILMAQSWLRGIGRGFAKMTLVDLRAIMVCGSPA